MFNEKLREIRVARGLSQVELANKLGVTKQCVSNWENDNIQPSIEMLLKISEILSVSCDCLLDIDERKYIEVTGLSEEELGHIQNIVNDIRKPTGN